MEEEISTKFPTPQHFFEWTEQLSSRIEDRDGVRWLRILYPEEQRGRDWRLDSDTPPVIVYFGAQVGQKVFATWTNKDNLGVGKIVAQKGPGITTILVASATEEVWPKVRPYWQLLCTEMNRQGWLAMSELARVEEQGQEFAEPGKESILPSLLPNQEEGAASDVVDLGLPESVTIINERLSLGAKSLFSLLEKSFASPMLIHSDAYTVKGTLLPDGTFWQFSANRRSETQLDIDAILFQNQNNGQNKRLLMHKETVGCFRAFTVSDEGNQSQVQAVSFYRHPEICGFLIDMTGDVLNRVNAWQWGRLERWRQETRARAYLSKGEARVKTGEPVGQNNQLPLSTKAVSRRGMNSRQKILLAVLLVAPLVVGLLALTLLVVSGLLSQQIAILLFLAGVVIQAATSWVGAWNNVIALVERIWPADNE